MLQKSFYAPRSKRGVMYYACTDGSVYNKKSSPNTYINPPIKDHKILTAPRTAPMMWTNALSEKQEPIAFNAQTSALPEDIVTTASVPAYSEAYQQDSLDIMETCTLSCMDRPMNHYDGTVEKMIKGLHDAGSPAAAQPVEEPSVTELPIDEPSAVELPVEALSVENPSVVEASVAESPVEKSLNSGKATKEKRDTAENVAHNDDPMEMHYTPKNDESMRRPQQEKDTSYSSLFRKLQYDDCTNSDGEGLLYYQRFWYLCDVSISVRGELLSGIPMDMHENTLRLINEQYSYFIPIHQVDYIRTPDGLETSFNGKRCF